MSINPYIFLGIGSVFAIFYAIVITIGWSITRRNRRIIHNAIGISSLPVMNLMNGKYEMQYRKECISIRNNIFEDKDGNPIDIDKYNAFIIDGESSKYPEIKNGDLVLQDKTGNIKYVFNIPDMRRYR